MFNKIKHVGTEKISSLFLQWNERVSVGMWEDSKGTSWPLHRREHLQTIGMVGLQGITFDGAPGYAASSSWDGLSRFESDIATIR